MAEIIHSLLDANIYSRDLVLFRSKCWLNDSCINYCLRRLELTKKPKSILLMDPSVVSFLVIQCSSDEDYDELFVGNNISTLEWIFVPVNNADSFDTPSSHWSLLMLHVPTGKLFHFDSCGLSNNDAAILTAEKLYLLVKRTDVPKIVTVKDCPQQNNAYDCGVYVILLAEYLVNQLAVHSSITETSTEDGFLTIFGDVKNSVNESTANSFRRLIFDEISGFSQTQIKLSFK